MSPALEAAPVLAPPRAAGAPAPLLLAAAAATLGLVDATVLTRAPAGALCAADGCGAVLASRWATVGGVPLAAAGVAGYAALLGALLVALGAGGRARGVALRVADAGALGGTLLSAGLVALQAGVLRAACVLCLASALLVTVAWIATGRARRLAWSPRPDLAAALALAALLAALGAASAAARGGAIVALVDGRPIAADELERALELPLHRLDVARHATKRRWLEQRVGDLALEDEARRRGTTAAALLAEAERSAVVGEERVDAWLEARARAPHAHAGEAGDPRAAARAHLVAEARAAARRALVDRLVAARDVRLLLAEPVAPTATFDPALGTCRGEPRAPVQLVIFSDFECPFCVELWARVERLQARVGGDRLAVWQRHFPLEGHARAPAAAAACEAAGLQGRFWEYHARLDAAPSALDDGALDGHAAALGLDVARFRRDRASDEVRARVERSRADGAAKGVAGLPALFLDGRPLAGGLPAEGELERLVEEALR